MTPAPARALRVALAVLLAAAIPGRAACADSPARADLLPAYRFAYTGDRARGFLLSPDGRKLAWIERRYLRSALHVRDLASGTVRHYAAVADGYRWTADGRWLVYQRNTTQSEDSHVFAIDTDARGADPVDLTPYPGVRATIQQLGGADPRHVLVLHNRRDRRLFDLYRIDLETREEQLLARNPGDGVRPVTDRDGTPRGWKRSREAQRPAAERRQPFTARLKALRATRPETFRPLAWSADRSELWALSSRGRDRVALVTVHPVLGVEKVRFEDPLVDVSGVEFSRVTGAPLLAYSQPGYPRVVFFDDRLERDLAGLIAEQGAEPFGLDIVSATTDEQLLVVGVTRSTTLRYYLVERAKHRHTLLAETASGDLAAALVPTRPVTLASRDGLELHGYLTLPRGVEAKKLPLVLHVHGGPWSRTGWGSPLTNGDATWAQFLANRGYAVLQVNFRGSTGYGWSFQAAGMGEFARRMHDDLLDAVDWAVARGIADPSRVAIMGRSYGGYASLVGLTMTPEKFACGISINGPTDLNSLVASFPPYWHVDLSMWHDFVGDPAIAADRADMARRSPLHHAASLRHPVLIVQGARDVRVRVDQADRMVAALRGAGKPVEYLRIEDMGHGMGWWVHGHQVMRASEDFLHRCLGGRAGRFHPFDALAWLWARISR